MPEQNAAQSEPEAVEPGRIETGRCELERLVEVVNGALMEDWQACGGTGSVRQIGFREPSDDAEAVLYGFGPGVPIWGGKVQQVHIQTLRALLHDLHRKHVLRERAMQLIEIRRRALLSLTTKELDMLSRVSTTP